MKIKITLLALLLVSGAFAQPSYDVCVYGGTSAGIIAACSAKRMGKSVLLIEPGNYPGGLSSGGLGYTDIGNKYVVTGLAKDFYRRVGTHYGKLEQWIFEPHVAEGIFKQYLKSEQIVVWYQTALAAVHKKGTVIQSIDVNKGATKRNVKAKEFIDCSYEGDLMAAAGVPYTVGRESNQQYNETYNGVQLLQGHQFPDGIDPYQIKDDVTSGLLWGISPSLLAVTGTGDAHVQSYNYRICLTDNPANRLPITRPAGYNPSHYELLARLMAAQPDKVSLNDYFIWSAMPGQKTDINNRNGFSTDMIGSNDSYPDGSRQTRSNYVQELTSYTKGLLYFVGHDLRVPIALRSQMSKWGYPKDEYVKNNHWSPQPYIREARRMIGNYVMTQANCTGAVIITDSVALAAYTMDSHNCQRIVVNGMVKNEGNVEIGGFPPYPIAYGALLPKPGDCTNLAVPVCLSASHIAYGSIRMEPVFMVLAEVAGVAASRAIDQSSSLQNVNLKAINAKIKNDPLLDGRPAEELIDNGDPSVRLTGHWQIKKGDAYGPDMFISNPAAGKSDEVRFYPKRVKPGSYQLYSYYPVLSGGADSTLIRIFDGTRLHRHVLIRSRIKVEGQTSGEWLPLGRFRFSGKGKPYIVICASGAAGKVAADAVLFKPVL